MLRQIKRKLIGIVSVILSFVSYKTLCQFMYLIAYKRLPDLKSPKLLSEKIMWSAIYKYRNDPLVSKCADKVEVREYVKVNGYSEVLNTVYGVWTNANDIEWDKLPEKFVLKCNHASGYNIVCDNKQKIDVAATVNRLNKWLTTDYWKQSGEIFYKNITPQIICEKYIETDDGKPPKDYKFFCSNGKVKFLFVAMDRINNQTKFNFFTPDWEPIPVTDTAHPPYNGFIKKPENLDEMISIAENLSKPWAQVRIDFYDEGNVIIFGEITFMHHGGKPHFSPSEYDRIFGDMIEL